MGHETIPTHENSPHTPDAIIVLGKNIGVDSTHDDIRRDNFNLSQDSRISAIAAGMLAEKYPGVDIIFSTGATTKGLPSEARSMKKYMDAHIRDVMDQTVVGTNQVGLEERSKDTAGNAREVAEILKNRKDKVYQNIGLVSVGYHVGNAATYFRNYGVPIDMEIASEEILAARSPRHARFVEAWREKDRVQGEIKKEAIRTKLQSSIDRKGHLLRFITFFSRAR